MKEYDGFLVDDNLNIYSKRTGNKLTPYIGTDGYMQVQYRNDEHKAHHNRVHVILTHCFIPNPDNLGYVNHIDSDKTNNSLSNLEWCTNSYNVYHGWHSGNRTHKNKTHITATIPNALFIKYFDSIRECGKVLNVDRHKVARILKGELPKDYMKYQFEYR